MPRLLRVPLASLTLAGVLASLAVPASALEADWRRWGEPGGYAGLSGLFVTVADADLDLPGCPACDDTLATDNGFGVSAVAGYRFPNHVRLEGEVAYRQNDLEAIELEGLGTVRLRGETSTFAAMSTLYYDLAPDGPVSPYLGAGIGVARIAVKSEDLDADDADTRLAYQFKVGLLAPIAPDWALLGGYTYFRTRDPKIEDFTSEYTSHTVEIGLRFLF